MAFAIAENSGHQKTVWAPLDYDTNGNTVYDGQLVYSTGDGVRDVATASGASDWSQKQGLAGIIKGSNNRTPVYDTTYQRNKITSLQAQADLVARDFRLVEGVWGKGDPQPMVELDVITPSSIIKAPIWNAAIGTAPTLLTATAGSTDGAVTGPTTNACEFTPVADLCTIYCRKGANRGLYRITTDTSTTVPTVAVAFPYDIAIGDQFVRVPLRPFGYSYAQTLSALGFNNASSPATNYYMIFVYELNLARAGQEYVVFRFCHQHFDSVRTVS